MKEIIFVGSARSYHVIDWYRTVKNICSERIVSIATDLVESEGYGRIITPDDNVIILFNNDVFLISKQSLFGNVWRNVIKLITLPIVAFRLKKLFKQRQDAIFHAHSMYYIFLCWAAGIKFIATPMGSDVLVRPDHSIFYKYFTIRSLRAAFAITVDSVALQKKIQQLCQKDSTVVQNGITTRVITQFLTRENKRTRFISIRGIDPNYRVYDLVQARNRSAHKPTLEFIYPISEESYKKSVESIMTDQDIDRGFVTREELFQAFAETILAISIPKSDSSPRTVYEAIFCGCCVAVAHGTWIDELPECMRSRLYVVDLNRENWFDEAVGFAKTLITMPYVPSKRALQAYDQEETMRVVCKKFYSYDN